jgi:ribosome recycling factor
VDDYLDALHSDQAGALDALTKELGKVRTGRATPKLLEGVVVAVQSYGTTMPINQLATIQAPDARLLVVTPWDKGTAADIEKSILAAGLGLNPQSDGQVIRVPVPALTQDRRKDLVKIVRKAGEDAKVRVRNIRREYNEIFKQGEKDGEITEDACKRLLEKVQQSTDQTVEKIDALVAKKEGEVLEV